MKVRILILFLAVLMCSCENDKGKISGDLVTNPKSAGKTSDKVPVMSFEKTEYDFGKILQGEVVSYTFRFTNTGKAPLLITSIDKSCGCTTSDYPREPIAPGQSSSIKLTYDSKGHFGIQNKTVVVNSNAEPSQISLRIKAEVYTAY